MTTANAETINVKPNGRARPGPGHNSRRAGVSTITPAVEAILDEAVSLRGQSDALDTEIRKADDTIRTAEDVKAAKTRAKAGVGWAFAGKLVAATDKAEEEGWTLTQKMVGAKVGLSPNRVSEYLRWRREAQSDASEHPPPLDDWLDSMKPGPGHRERAASYKKRRKDEAKAEGAEEATKKLREEFDEKLTEMGEEITILGTRVEETESREAELKAEIERLATSPKALGTAAAKRVQAKLDAAQAKLDAIEEAQRREEESQRAMDAAMRGSDEWRKTPTGRVSQALDALREYGNPPRILLEIKPELVAELPPDGLAVLPELIRHLERIRAAVEPALAACRAVPPTN